ALIRQGYRYRDIAVVVRSSAEWEEIIAPVMRLFNIPVFMDRRVPVDNFPITAFIVGAMNVVCGSYKSEDILRWLKTGLTDISEDEVFTLENYIFTWDISGKQWLTPFTLNPEGYVPESEKTKTKLEAINDIRKRAVAPIEKFASAAGDTDIFHIASALYALMCDCHADTHLQELAEKLEQTDGELASRQLRMWDVIIGLLDQSVQLLGKERMSLADFSQLFGYMLGTSDLGSIPSYTDQVTFAQADRTRLDDPKILFVLGANEGKFPKAVSSFGAFTDTERRRLEQLGVNVAKPSENMALDERLLNYFTLTQPSQKLFVSYSLSDTDSSPLSPSETVEIIKNVLPDIEINKYHSAESCDDLETDAQSFEVLARRYGKKDALSQGLCSYFEQKPEYKSRLRALGRAAQNRPFEFENPAVARRLFGEKMLLSATRVENFSTCKFKYFCRFGLGAYPRLSAKVDAMRYGSVMHYVFENVFTRYGGRKISKLSSEELTQVIRTLIADYIEREMGGTLDKTPRFMYLFEKLADTAYLLVKKMGEEFAQSDFETAAYELSISPNGKVKPLTIRTKSGIELSVIGSVDRVDVMTGENGNYFRVVDYKTSKKMFGLSDILYGLNMQMLIYLIAIWKNGGEIFPGYLPAGVLYMPAIKPQPSKSRDPVSGEQTTICMNGLLLGEPRVLSGMEKALAGKFIPVKLKSDGSFLGENSLVTLSQFGQIAEHIEVLLEKMAQSLCGGDIEALPTVLSKSPCEYCDYSAVCGHEKDSPSVLAEKFDKAAVLEKLCVKEEEK
ncbi:MAG: PD-(D/E)XK nuclease family protein, partial [Clostridia bacterium]|nr:PD-(D/E)XK nuclease family protein [Clostridia bacterium]